MDKPKYLNWSTTGISICKDACRIDSLRGRRADLDQFILYPDILPNLSKIDRICGVDLIASPR